MIDWTQILSISGKIGNVAWDTFPVWGSIAIALTVKWFGGEKYFKTALLTLENVDDITEKLKLEFPNNPTIETADNLVDEVVKELKQAGIKVKPEDKRLVGQRVKSNLNKDEGVDIDWDKEGEIKLNYTKNF